MQYVELAFTFYDEYYSSTAILLAISLVGGFFSTRAAYTKRLQLYTSIAKHHLLPCVLDGYVR